MNSILNKLKLHYLIFTKYIKEPIGCTCGRQGKQDVLCEEPTATFKLVPIWKCPICSEE